MDELLKLGTPLYLELTVGGKNEKYKTNIAEIKENELFIELPINEKTNKYSFFYLNTVFQAYYFDSGKVYHFNAELLRRIKDNIPLLVLSFPGEENLSIIQRRQHVRVETALDVAIHPLHNEFPAFTTMSVDISGGGIAVHLPKNYGFHPGQEVEMWIVLPMVSRRYVYSKIRCEVVRQYYSGNNLRASFKFSHLSNHDHQQIIRYTLDKDLYYQRKIK